MSDGHLFLDSDGVAFAGESSKTWYDESHGHVLVMAPHTRQLREISLRPPHQFLLPHSHNYSPPKKGSFTRSKSAPALAFEPSLAHEPHDDQDDQDSDTHKDDGDVLFDFTLAMMPRIADDSILLVRLSLDREFLAIQKSDVEVQIVRLATRESYWIVCKAKAGNRILADGVLWNTHASMPQSSQDLFLVTRIGIEQYRVSTKRRSCALHRSIGVYVHTFWYSARHSVLFVSTGSRANEIVPFAMQGATVEKVPRLVFSSAVRKRDLYLASLYDELYAVYGDMKTSRLLLYRVAKDKVTCVRSLHLMLPVGCVVEFSVVDNLLVCHSVEFSVSLFFDVRCDASVHDPFSHPLPVSLAPPASHHHRLHVDGNGILEPASSSGQTPALLTSIASANGVQMTHHGSAHMDHNEHASNETSHGHVVSPWRFLAPDLVQRSITTSDQESGGHDDDQKGRVEIRRFHLNLDQVSRSCAQHTEIVPFLLRRTDQQVAKRLALSIVRERLEEQAVLPAAANLLLASVQTMSHHDLEDRSQRRRNRGGGGGSGGGASDESSNDTSSDDELQFPYGLSPRTVVPMSIRKRFLHREVSSPSILRCRPVRNGNGLTLIHQTDFWLHLWKPLLANQSVSSTGVLSTYLIEFICLLRHNQVPVETLTYTALAKAYLLAGKTNELVQALHLHMIDDSLVLADLLLSHSTTTLPLRQLALDMYTRLGSMTQVVEMLLETGDLDQAIAVAWKHMRIGSCDALIIPGSRFFESCVRRVQKQRAHSSALVVQQQLHSLLLFLRIWDGACLLGEPSLLATSVFGAFPDGNLPASTRRRWRKCFGFPPS